MQLNPEASEFRPKNLPITYPPTFLPAPPVLENIVTLLSRTITSPSLKQLIETYKCVLTFIASNPDTFDQQTECLRTEILNIPQEEEITKHIKEGLVKMNIELAIVEPEYRRQSARVCLSIDSFLEEYYQKECKECQDLSMDYLKARYLSFHDKIQSNPPDLLEELVGYAATMADYLTRLRNQETSVEQMGLAMIEVLTETLDRGFTTDNVKTMYDAVKMSCRTLLSLGSLSEKLERFRTKMRDVCLSDSANMEVRKLLLKLLEYISYNEGNRDCVKQTTIHQTNKPQEESKSKTNGPQFEAPNSEEWEDFLPTSFVPGPEIPVTELNEWDDFLDENGKPIESPIDEYGEDLYLAGPDLLSPSMARDLAQFDSGNK